LIFMSTSGLCETKMRRRSNSGAPIRKTNSAQFFTPGVGSIALVRCAPLIFSHTPLGT